MFSLKPYVFSFQWADQLKRFDIFIREEGILIDYCEGAGNLACM
jgi:hypothetical protein